MYVRGLFNAHYLAKPRELSIHIMIDGKAGMEEVLVPLVLDKNTDDDRKLCTLLESHNSKTKLSLRSMPLDLTTDDYIVEYESGVSLPIDIPLADIVEDLYIYRRKMDAAKPRKSMLGGINPFGDAFKGMSSDLYHRRKELLGDPNKRSPLLTLKPDVCTLHYRKLIRKELAQALTAIEHELFTSLHEAELIGTEWKKKSKHIRAPNVVSMINWFNRVRAESLNR